MDKKQPLFSIVTVVYNAEKTIEETIQSEEANLNKHAKLKQALMKDLLTGKVRVSKHGDTQPVSIAKDIGRSRTLLVTGLRCV